MSQGALGRALGRAGMRLASRFKLDFDRLCRCRGLERIRLALWCRIGACEAASSVFDVVALLDIGSMCRVGHACRIAALADTRCPLSDCRAARRSKRIVAA